VRLLVTGGLGFIGSNFVRHVLARRPEARVVNLDLITYAGNPANLADVAAEHGERYRLVRGDVRDMAAVLPLVEEAEAVVHLAAESHVDRSIEDATEFVTTNVVGTQVMLEAARRAWQGKSGRRFLHVSTDEVYGALALDDTRRFDESWPLDPKSPYSASKAGADLLAQAYHHTHGLPVMITRSCNNYGPRQFPEKLIPLMTLNAAAGRELPVYGDGRYVRDWIHVYEACRATELVLERGEPGKVYNIGAGSERSNLEVVQTIIALVAQRLGREAADLKKLVRHVADRPGHDRRYAIDNARLAALGFEPALGFEDGLARTVDWYLDNPQWCQAVTSGAYRDYYQRMYQGR